MIYGVLSLGRGIPQFPEVEYLLLSRRHCGRSHCIARAGNRSPFAGNRLGPPGNFLRIRRKSQKAFPQQRPGLKLGNGGKYPGRVNLFTSDKRIDGPGSQVIFSQKILELLGQPAFLRRKAQQNNGIGRNFHRRPGFDPVHIAAQHLCQAVGRLLHRRVTRDIGNERGRFPLRSGRFGGRWFSGCRRFWPGAGRGEPARFPATAG